jgi:hypothetical protein
MHVMRVKLRFLVTHEGQPPERLPFFAAPQDAENIVNIRRAKWRPLVLAGRWF